MWRGGHHCSHVCLLKDSPITQQNGLAFTFGNHTWKEDSWLCLAKCTQSIWNFPKKWWRGLLGQSLNTLSAEALDTDSSWNNQNHDRCDWKFNRNLQHGISIFPWLGLSVFKTSVPFFLPCLQTFPADFCDNETALADVKTISKWFQKQNKQKRNSFSTITGVVHPRWGNRIRLLLAESSKEAELGAERRVAFLSTWMWCWDQQVLWAYTSGIPPVTKQWLSVSLTL